MGIRGAEVVWTDASLVERGVVHGIGLDLVVGDTDDFEATVPTDCPVGRGSAIAVVGTEYGGIVDDISSTTTERRRKVSGRTWRGVLASRVIEPPEGSAYLTFDGDAHAVMRSVVSACDLSWLFSVPASAAGISISGRFDRYTDALSGLTKALSRVGARLSCEWDGASVVLSAEPKASVSVDALKVPVTIRDSRPVNHLVCLGSGQLEERLVVDVYADHEGNVSPSQTLTGSQLVVAVYGLSGGSDEQELLAEGTAKLAGLQACSPVEIDLDGVNADLHVGDVVVAENDRTGVSAAAEISRVIVKVEGGRVRTTLEAVAASASSGPTSTGDASAAALTAARSAMSVAESAQETARDGAFLVIASTNGQLFKNGSESTVLQAVVFPNGGDRLETIQQVRSRFGAAAYIEWQWMHESSGQWGTLVSSDEHISQGGMWLTVTPEDVDSKTTFRASLVVPGEGE